MSQAVVIAYLPASGAAAYNDSRRMKEKCAFPWQGLAIADEQMTGEGTGSQKCGKSAPFVVLSAMLLRF
jgi:hypothetical protein